MARHPWTAEEQAVLDAARSFFIDSVAGVDDNVLAAIHDALRRVVPFDRLTVLVENEGKKSFSVLWRVPVEQSDPVVPLGVTIPYDRIFEGFGDDPTASQPRIVEDIRKRGTRFAEAAQRAGVLSYVVLPLVHRGAGLGWFVVAHEQVGAPSQGALPLLIKVAETLGPAVARAREWARYRLLASLVDESPDGMLALDRDLVVTEANVAVQRMLGKTRDALLGRTLADAVGEGLATTLSRAALEEDCAVIPRELQVGDSGVPVNVLITRVTGSTEANLQVHFRDDGARRAAEEATQRRVEQLAFLRALGGAMAADLRADKALARAVDLCFVRFELGALCALRVEGEGVLRHVASHGIGARTRASLARTTPTAVERLIGVATPDAPQAELLLEVTGVRLPDDSPETPPRWAKLVPLIHARRRLGALLIVGHPGESPSGAEREIWESIASTIAVALHAAAEFEHVVALEAEKRRLVDNLPVIVARLDPGSGATLFINAAVERVLGVETREALGSPGVEALLADPIEREASAAARARAAKGQDTSWQDRRYRHRGGQLLTLREHVYPVFDAEGRVHAVEVVAYDVTTEIESRKQLMQADRLASLGALAAGIAHEINNPVAFIGLAAGQIGRLLDRLRDPSTGAEARMREIAQELGDAAGRIAEIVGELKLFTRIADATVSTPIDVNRILQTALTLTGADLRSRAKVEVELGDLPLAPGAFTVLGQVFVNLLINAAQAIDANGAGAGPNVVRVASAVRDGAIVVTVSDTGVGIEGQLLPRIFDPFFTTHAAGHGAGLGLAIAYDLVRRIGGDIRVQSARGSGTTFEVLLPLETSRSESSRALEEPPEVERVERTPRGRVLIIDDEEPLVKALARQLADRFDVDTASNASDARARLSTRDYDAVVCDLRMPDQSGPAIHDAVALRSPDQAARFIFTTGGSYGVADDELHERANRTGRPVLEKPFDGASFEALVASVAVRG